MELIENNLKKIIDAKEKKEKCHFKPTRSFFKNMGIGQKRFYQLVRQQVSLTFSEMERLSEYFEVHILELHDCTVKYIPKNLK